MDGADCEEGFAVCVVGEDAAVRQGLGFVGVERAQDGGFCGAGWDGVVYGIY